MANKRYPKPRKWKPNNPEKYEGDFNNIITRSSWEVRFLKWCDSDPTVISYSSEEFFIPYISALTPEKPRRYFPDAKIKVRTPNGVKIYVVEIKPHKERFPSTSRIKKTYLAETETYIVNQCKWKYAKAWCEQRGYEFIILDEYDLGISVRKPTKSKKRGS
jgi:hypothetical protein